MSVRKVKSQDIHELAKLAQKGYQTSPVYSFVRTKAKEYPEDTVKSYRQELRLLAANPKLKFDVLELNSEMNNNSEKPTPQVTIRSRSRCGSRKMPRWNSKCKKSESPIIVGFAIWRLDSNSEKIQRSIWKKAKCGCLLSTYV